MPGRQPTWRRSPERVCGGYRRRSPSTWEAARPHACSTSDWIVRTQTSRQGGITVADVAFRWGGFGHPGRFAAAFRKRYGVTPTEVLRG